MPTNKPGYNRKYHKERRINVVPATKDLAFIREMKLQKPAMSRSAIAAYLIRIGIQTLTSQKNSY